MIYKIICGKCGREFDTELWKKSEHYKQGKKVLCDECIKNCRDHWIKVLSDAWRRRNEKTV